MIPKSFPNWSQIYFQYSLILSTVFPKFILHLGNIHPTCIMYLFDIYPKSMPDAHQRPSASNISKGSPIQQHAISDHLRHVEQIIERLCQIYTKADTHLFQINLNLSQRYIHKQQNKQSRKSKESNQSKQQAE